MHPDTEALLVEMLEYLAENGEEATNDYIRREILHTSKKVATIKRIKERVRNNGR